MTTSVLKRISSAASVLLPLLFVAVIWWPEYKHYQVTTPRLDESLVSAARTAPADSLLETIGSHWLSPYRQVSGDSLIAIAEGILRGRVEFPGFASRVLQLPFSSDDLDQADPRLRLWYAALLIPDVLLSAYMSTGRQEFFQVARDYLIEWSRYEMRAWRPQGYLWNDHAVSGRVRVLAQFWRLYRGRPDYDPRVGSLILRQAARHREFLSDPRHFTFATNHGLIQNAALLQLAVGFPSLPSWESYQNVGLRRLSQQIPFFIDRQGVIRENSAGYQAAGLEILALTFRTMTLLDIPVPEDWKRRYQQGLAFHAALQRPDGTLPANGDTNGAPRPRDLQATEIDDQGRSSPLHRRHVPMPPNRLNLHAAAGYWVVWQGLENWPDPAGLRQTVATWTQPPLLTHKHADELSVLLWSDGISWLTSVGYWPYGHELRQKAESWASSNAPHLAQEPKESARTAHVLGTAATDSLFAIDLQRQGPGHYRVRRQVISLAAAHWIIVDIAEGKAEDLTQTIWTFPPNVESHQAEAPHVFILTGPRDAEARVEFLTSDQSRITTVRGSASPFGGWHVINSKPLSTAAVIVNQTLGPAWLAVVLSIGKDLGSEEGDQSSVIEMNSPEDWAVAIPTLNRTIEVRRNGDVLTAHVADNLDERMSVSLGSPARSDPEVDSVRHAYNHITSSYPVFRNLSKTRVKATNLLLALFVAQELLLVILRRFGPNLNFTIRLASITCWIGLWTWLSISFSFLESYRQVLL